MGNENRKGKKPYRKGNGKTGNSKGRKGDEIDKTGLNTVGRDNDPNWYFTSPELAQQASELSFQNMLGAGPILYNYEVPSIMVFRMNPCPGNTYSTSVTPATNPASGCSFGDYDLVSNQSGINLMATKIYTLLSTYSGRTSQYGPEDVSIMMLSIGEVASLVEHIRRAFGVAMSYSPRNRMLPLGLLNAMNINGEDLMKNLANYRMRFNVSISRINQIPILDNVGYIRKCRDMYQRIYVDDTSSMAQMYFYVPDTTWVLEEAHGSYDLGSVLVTTPVAQDSVVKISDLLTTLETMINNLLFSSTLNIVYSDLINLANKINVPFTQFDYLAENYVVLPEYNRNANLQMHNLTVIGKPSAPEVGSGANDRVSLIPVKTNNSGWKNDNSAVLTAYNNVYASSTLNGVVYNPGFMYPNSDPTSENPTTVWYTGDQIVDMDTDQPSVEDRIEALRFKAMESGHYVHTSDSVAPYNSNGFKVLLALPDHYCTEVRIYSNPTTSGKQITHSVSIGSHVKYSEQLSQCASHPIMYYKEDSQGYMSKSIKGVLGSLNFFTTIGYDYLDRLNKLITTGLFDFRTK